MSHPYKDQANSSHKTKAGNMGKAANLDLPIMRAVGENSPKKLYSSSSSSQQHKDQSAADGMKRGGHVGKPRHSKPKMKIAIAAPEGPVNPPLPDPTMAAAGAGPSPAPAPMPPPGQPPMKKGGAAYARGGKVSLDASFSKKGGADAGTGRLYQYKKYKAKGG